MAGKPWTEEEKTFIRENYLRMTCQEMADALGSRTKKSVEHYCRTMGLERPEPKKGDKFGRWELLTDKYFVQKYGQQIGMAMARCECGTEREVKITTLVSGKAQSCGCLKNEKASERCKKRNRTHGMTSHPLYSQWVGMIGRCTYRSHISFDNYGGRGIEVCEEWLDFRIFSEWALKNGWQPGLTLDRKKTNEGYRPDNCRFITCKENCNNKRNNRLVTAFGETKTLQQWTEDPRCKATYSAIHNRLSLLEWSAERAITTPVRTPKRKVLSQTAI